MCIIYIERETGEKDYVVYIERERKKNFENYIINFFDMQNDLCLFKMRLIIILRYVNIISRCKFEEKKCELNLIKIFNVIK